MTIVLLSGDLMVMSRVSGAAAQRGLELETAADARQAVQLCRDQAAHMLIVDLSTPSLDVVELVASVKNDSDRAPTIVAFGPHVHEDRLAAARDAGCDQVVSRGQFFGQLHAMLQL